jgi:transposase
MKKQTQDLIAEAPGKNSKVEMTIGIDLAMSGVITARSTKKGEVVDRGRFRTTLDGVERWFTDLPPVRIAMEAGTHSI